MDSTSFLFGLIQLKYPSIKALSFDKTLPLLGRTQFSVSRVFFQFLFYLGLASSAYFIFRGIYKSGRWLIDWIKSMFNANKYLNSSNEKTNSPHKKYYAVIYGTGNIAGFAYSHYLANKGYNLILIDRDATPINDVELSIKDVFKKNTPEIVKIVLNKFDQESLSKQLHSTRDLPIKLFINCKNSRKKSSQESRANQLLPDIEDGNESDDVEEGISSKRDEIISREEVYFTGKENIEGLACLLNIFLTPLLQSSHHPAVLNIDNDQDLDENNIKKGQLFFQATINFQDTFTTLLQRQVKGALKTINVKVKFNNLRNNQAKQLRMCEKSFQYLGISDNIHID
eukprot:403340320